MIKKMLNVILKYMFLIKCMFINVDISTAKIYLEMNGFKLIENKLQKNEIKRNKFVDKLFLFPLFPITKRASLILLLSEGIIMERIEKSFFEKERFYFKMISTLCLFITISVTLFFIFVLILPFFNIRGLINNLPYFGWPIYSLLFMMIWFPGLFIGINMHKKNKMTDHQLILEKKSIKKSVIIYLVPSLFTSIIFLFIISKFHNSKDFRNFRKINGEENEQLWLSDSRPLKSSESASLGVAWFIVLLWTLIILYPIYQLIKQTFNGNLDLILSQTSSYKFSLKHFTRLFANYDYWNWMYNTLFIAIITMISVVILSAFSAYIYSRNRFKTQKASLLLVMTLGLMPAAAALAAYYSLSVILEKGLGLSAKWLLIFIYAGGGTVGNIFVLKGYLDNISTEMDDAARIDGCSKIKVFWKIILPLMRPMLAITAIGSFIGPFGDFILPGILFKEPRNYTLAQGLQSLVSNSNDQTAFAAGAILIAIPITIIVVVSQTFITKGSTHGGVK